ncbi:endonuclease/exonuclease/phosphatase family protein [Roseicyclus sp.]|uniref:endonuclease/exonuclease/phosphatase family protein n=1 Tax=Roseicyclus sp. TaxID=1914329 RepID=UPI003FA0E477
MSVRAGFAGACAALSLVATGAAFFGWVCPTECVFGPLARMLDAFAPGLLALGLGFAVVAALLGGRFAGGVLALLALAGGGLHVSSYRAHTLPAVPGAEAALRVLFFNVRADNTASAAEIVEAARVSGADIAVFAEASALRPALDALGEAYAFVTPCAEEACEILVATSLPVRRSWRLSLNAAWPDRYAVLEVEVPGQGPLFLAASHLVKPWMSGIAEPEIARLTAQWGWFEGPVIAVGDFNMAPWSRPMRVLMEETGFRGLRGQPGTWAAAPGIPALPIDQVLVRGGPRVVAFETFGAGLGSNHLGFVADIALSD